MCDVIQDKMQDGRRRLVCFTHKITLIEPMAEMEDNWNKEHASQFCVCFNQSAARLWDGVCVICEKPPAPVSE